MLPFNGENGKRLTEDKIIFVLLDVRLLNVSFKIKILKPQNEVIHSLLFPEQFSLYQMEKEGNAFGVKKIRTLPCVHTL